MPYHQAQQWLRHYGFFGPWMSKVQRLALMKLLDGEERAHWLTLLTELKARIEAMPVSYQTDGQGEDAIVHLHYFASSYDGWVTEKDAGVEPEQYQAFGFASFSGRAQAEAGYICVQELIDNGVELDLYWTPQAMKEVK